MEEKELKGQRRKEREEKRKQKILKKLKKKEAEQINIKIAIEERKLLMAQRKLESIRLLDELFERVKQEKLKELAKKKHDAKEDKSGKGKKKDEKVKKKDEKLKKKQKEMRKKLVKKIKTAQEQQMEERREKLLRTIEGKNKLKSILRTKDEDDLEEFDSYRHPEYADFDPFHDYPSYDVRGSILYSSTITLERSPIFHF